MNIIKATYEFESDMLPGIELLRQVERAARTCYKSEANNPDKDEAKTKAFIKMLIDRGHEAMLEHASVAVRIYCDRGVSHELVRHRIAAYAQESTRYCNYGQDKFGNEVTFIDVREHMNNNAAEAVWLSAMKNAEDCYLGLIKLGISPQFARSVLPTSLKTEIVITVNLREWRHIFKLRTAKAAHPQMREIMVPLLKEMKAYVPVVFDDIQTEG